MHIVVNTRLLIKDKLDGIGWFTFQTMKRLVQTNPTCKFTFLFDRPYAPEFIFGSNVTAIVLSPPARHPLLYILYFEFAVKRFLKKAKPDLFVSTDGFLVLDNSIKQLPVLHDINFLHHPMDLKYAYRKYYNFFFPKFAKVATRIATVSNYSKSDIVKNYQINTSKIDVVYNGINDGYCVLGLNQIASTHEKYTHGNPYFVFVGSQSPRKNLARLIKAYSRFRENQATTFHLVLAGSSFWGDASLKAVWEQSNYKADIHFTGRLNQDELTKVVGASFALCFIPYYEGFGIPMIEAMAAGVPVIAANTSCLPEIAGEAALFVNPFDEVAIAAAMQKLATDPKLQAALIEKGLVQAEKYSWDKTAELLWESMQKAIANS
jgi:glycosyltransferase involved in cell wall biosynthesis